MNSIRFLTDAEVERFKGYELLKEYIAAKETELSAWNEALDEPGEAA